MGPNGAKSTETQKTLLEKAAWGYPGNPFESLRATTAATAAVATAVADAAGGYFGRSPKGCAHGFPYF